MATMRHGVLLFKWCQFEPKIIVCAVRWYLGHSLVVSRRAGTAR
jgi:hypothetical protein